MVIIVDIIKNLIYKICSILSYDGDIKWDSSKLEGQLLRFMNLDKLKTYNFKPKVDLDEGLKKTIFWYKDQKKSKIERYRISTISFLGHNKT